MERNGIGMISLHYSANDFRDLNLEINSDEQIWDVAIEMFRERFEERYFDPIRELMYNPEKNGFAIMAINCLMVDAFYQFEYGDTSTRNNARRYTMFLSNKLHSIFYNERMADCFYKHIRCGILHSAQTTDGSMLSTECYRPIEFFRGEACIKVNVVEFSRAMRDYFEDYIMRLRNNNNRLRLNFITKMNIICRE